MLGSRYTYEKLKNKYGEFYYPMVNLIVGGKNLAENKLGLVISDLVVDLSVGYEASVVSFRCYNAFNEEEKSYSFDKLKSYIMLGMDISVELGYADVFTEVFSGFISQVEFVSYPGDPHHIEVTAMDAKGMMMSNSCARQMKSTSYGDAVKEIFTGAVYQKMQSMGIITGFSIEDTPDKEPQSDAVTSYAVEMVSESDYEFVVKAAKKFNYEFYIDNGKICFRKSKGEQNDCLIEIGMDRGLVFYRIGYDITGLVKSVEVRGMDVAKGNVISAKNKASNKISVGNKAKSLISQTEKIYIDANSVTKKIAEQRAEAIMEDIAYRFGNLECECIGIPELKPGYFIEIADLGKPAENKFYITNVKHVMTDQGGYRTVLTGKAATLK